ncbi:hypothetical protein [Ferrovibrio sp.]|uniref:hypothetical protein n=1 Tax=Ferrovibrio sp. TaxID=1917215 RepID=UPI001B758B87|nr:hypothetical protein [Ferrovibrio sp.]MBP7063228.1 hypothetical protein [Ferrovibrio sp.]
MAPTNTPRRPAQPATAPRQAAAHVNEDEAAEPERSSDLDEATHAEYRLLYQEAGHNIRFGKGQQWRVLEYFTLLSFGLVAICGFVPMAKDVINFVAYFLLFTGIAVLIVIGMLQAWQYGEARKLDRLADGFSSAARSALRVKGRLGSDINRYVILLILLLLVIVSDIVAFRLLSDLAR